MSAQNTPKLTKKIVNFNTLLVTTNDKKPTESTSPIQIPISPTILTIRSNNNELKVPKQGGIAGTDISKRRNSRMKMESFYLLDNLKQSEALVKNQTFLSELCEQTNESLFPRKYQKVQMTTSVFPKTIDNTLISKYSRDTTTPKGIFWSKKVVEFVWGKLRQVKNKVIQKKENDYEQIKLKIMQNREEEVYEQLTNEEFIKFYRNKDALYPEDVFLDIMAVNMKFDLLLQILKNTNYKFDSDYIFRYIYVILNPISSMTSTEKEIHPLEAMSSKHKFQGLSHNGSRRLVISYDNKNKTNIIDGIIENTLYNYKDEKRTKIIGWLLAYMNYYETFQLFVRRNKCYHSELEKYNKFELLNDIKNYCDNPTVVLMILEYCLKCNFEDMAIFLLDYNRIEIDISSLITYAAEMERMEFLKYIWEKDYATFDENQPMDFLEKKHISNLSIHKYHNYQMVASLIPTVSNHNNSNNNYLDKPKIISLEKIIKILTKSTGTEKKTKEKHDKTYNSNVNLNKILQWKGINNDPTFISTLFENYCFEQINSLIYKWPSENFSDLNYFEKVIDKEQTELIIYFLRNKKEMKVIFKELKIQKMIVEQYTKHGDKLYYGAEMLMYIHKNQWNIELTKSLCKNIIKSIKTKDISNCHSIILTCLLLCEFLTQIKEISIANVSRCEKVMSELKEYCKNIQESNPQENYISYLMKQKDTRDRSAFQIASENQIYCLLETAEVGTIVKKMWDGKLSNNGFLAASSLHRYLESDKKVTEPFLSFNTLDMNKVYFFQFCVWTDSCSLRYKPEGLSTMIMIILYNILIYLLALTNQMLNSYSELELSLRILLTIYIIWVTSLMLGMIIQVTFFIKTKRKFKMDVWNYMDILLCLFAWLILLDTRQLYFRSTNNELTDVLKNVLWDLEIPFTKELKTEINEYSNSFAFILKTFILAINDVLVWLRITGILLTYKEMGPVIRMIVSMAILLVKYLLIIALFLACCASIFTAIFNQYSNQFSDFSTSIITLFGGFLNNFDTNDFTPEYQVFGSVLFMIYVCIAGVLLVNLLIAVLSNVYEELAKEVDASHRAVLIQYYRKSKWDDEYGYLIFLKSPLSVVNYITLIISLFVTKNRLPQFNLIVSKIYYVLFYYPFILLSYMIYTIILIPICYIKGIIVMIKYQSGLKILLIIKLLNVFKWVFGGIFYLFFIYFRDILFSLKNIFNSFEPKDSDLQRISKNLTEDDVIVFLKFIHSKIPLNTKKDIHTLFLAYLDFESNEVLQENDELKKKKEYMEKINMTISNANAKKILQASAPKGKTILMCKGDDHSKMYSKFLRKNLMILEILENFVFDDEFGTSIVDVDKMKKLLPMTMSIKKPYLRRLMHSDAHALNQAMTKLKISKNIFLQYQLINKIMCSAQRLDKEIDSEILKIQRMRATEKKNEEKRSSLLEKNEEEEKIKNIYQKKQELNLMRKYDKMLKMVLSNITETIASKKDNFVSNSEKGNTDIISKRSRISDTPPFLVTKNTLK